MVFQEMKVVMLEDLAAHFKLKTQVGFSKFTVLNPGPSEPGYALPLHAV